jgi:hypothetical protein
LEVRVERQQVGGVHAQLGGDLQGGSECKSFAIKKIIGRETAKFSC